MKPSSDYIRALKSIRDHGKWIENKRTGTKCLTKINLDLTYDVEKGQFPLDTTRKSYWKAAVAELLGYIRGYTCASQFAALGANTWFANANENEAWLNNPNRRGENDVGRIYGAVGNNWPIFGERDKGIDLLESIVDDLSKGIDNRGEIYTFWNPGMFHLGSLRPCLHSHQFSLVEDELYLNSTQRSWDGLLGGNFNSVQCYVLLALIAQITNNKPMQAFHKVVNGHIYDNQYDIMIESGHLEREEFDCPTFTINPDIKSLNDLRTWVSLDDFKVENYHHHEAIKYPFTA